MPGFLLHLGATVMCAHAGQAMPTAPNPRVLVGGQPVTTQSAPYTVAGCPFVPPAAGPCVTAQWVMAATRVMVGGQPALLQDSMALCTPTGTPLTIVMTQVRVKGDVMDIYFPYHIDSQGRTATADGDGHVRDLIEQVLFTSPGERVNRPTFGCGLMQLIFAPNGSELAAATQMLVQGSLQQWLGDVIQVEAVDVEHEDSTLRIAVRYVVRRNQQRQQATFVRQV